MPSSRRGQQLFALRPVLEDFAAEEAVSTRRRPRSNSLRNCKTDATPVGRQQGPFAALDPVRKFERHVPRMIVAASGNQYLARLLHPDPDARADRHLSHQPGRRSRCSGGTAERTRSDR